MDPSSRARGRTPYIPYRAYAGSEGREPQLVRAEDYLLAERIWGHEAIREALLQARRGDIDPKSANFWRLRFSIDVSPK